MKPAPPMTGARFWVTSLLVAAMYVLTAKVGMLLATVQGNVTPIWPPAGIALAALLLWGPRLAPAVALGALVATAGTGAPWHFSLTVAVGNTAAALAGLWVLNRQKLDRALGRVREIIALVLWGALAAGVVSATFGAAGLLWAGMVPPSQWSEPLLIWWLGDSMGVVVMTPVILYWFARPLSSLKRAKPLELFSWALSAALVSMFLFGGWASAEFTHMLVFLSFPLLLWAALRFGRRLTAFCAMVLCYATVAATSMGAGPFAEHMVNGGMVLLWAYLGSLVVTSLALATAVGQTQRVAAQLSRHRDELAQAVERRTAQLVSSHQELWQSHQRTQAVLDGISDGFFTLDHNMVFTHFNATAERLLKRRAQEVLGLSFADAFPEAAGSVLERRYRQAIQEKRPQAFETFFEQEPYRNWFDVRIYPSENGISVFFQVTTAQKEAALALARSEERLRTLVEETPLGVAVISSQDEYVYTNPQFTRIFGYQREETPRGREWFRRAFPDANYRREVLEVWRRDLTASKVGQVRPRTFRVTCKSGEAKTIEFRPVTLSTGEQLVIYEDVSERENALRALKASEEKFSKAFQHSPMWVVLSSLEEGRLFEVNETFLRSTGYTRQEVTGKTILDLGLNTNSEGRTRVVEALRREGSVSGLEVRMRTKAGRLLNMLYYGTMIEVGDERLVLSLLQDITEAKRAEEALRASEEKFQKLYMASPVWMNLSTLKDGRILEVNEAFHRVTGYSREETINTTSVDLGLWEDPREREGIRQTLEREGFLRNHPVTYKMKDGQIRHFLLSAELVEVDSETALISALLDVTDLIRVQDALSDSEAHFRSVVENSLSGIYVIQDGKLAYVNPRLVGMLGFSKPEELLDHAPWEYVHPEDREMVKSGGWLRQHHEVAQRHYTFRAIRGDGKTIWLEALDAHIMYQGRKANLGNVVDITKRKAAEEALKQSEEQYRLLVDNAQDAIYILQDGIFVFANPEVERLIGYTQEELRSLDFKKVIHPDHLPLVSQRYLDRLAGKPTVNDYAMRILAKDGSERWIQTKGILITWKERPALLYTSRDITRQRVMEAQLRQSQKLEAIGTLAGGIAHDFNNMLAAIMGYAELSLDSTIPGSELAENLEQVLKAGERGRGLVQQILSFSRGAERETEPLDLGALAAEALKLLRAAIPSNITIKTRLEPCGPVRGDPIQLHQLLVNLVTNAAQAMEESGGTIELSLEPVQVSREEAAQTPGLMSGPYVRLVVSDTGPGVPPELRERVFEPFFTTKETGKGSGLGLAAVHGIVQSHMGAITLAEKEGPGASFVVLLPEDQEAQLTADHAPAQPNPTGNERVMFVDDEVSLVEVGGHILRRLGYRVSPFTSSLEAL
ncbi:MAG: PAS domain S-box protein, partial [Proteobacteria bacterium]|nr:PAS domain S-box protein [Pseudomonadota bacterium]